MKSNLNISFIGGGNMAAALIGGLYSKISNNVKINVIDLNSEVLRSLEQCFGVTTATEIDGTIKNSEVIILAVKPQQMREVATQLRSQLTDQLVLSIAAGVRISDLARWLGGYDTIVRCMPNMPALIGQGISGMVATEKTSLARRNTADSILRAVGSTVWVENEEKIDAITAVSGSGPAYVFYFIEAIQQAAQELGLNEEQSAELVKATFIGAAQLAVQSSESVYSLRKKITSKNGTTYAALRSMEISGLKKDIIAAVKSAAIRGHELSFELGENE